ncbi:MAG: rRNA maturation RNase YbeY [Lachnospirales bacterium]
MKLLIENETTFSLEPYLKDIEKIILEVLEMENINKNVEISLTIVCDNEMQTINKEHRGIDKTTDVLSFPMYTSFQLDFTNTLPLGDIIISKDKLIEQSIQYNHSQKRELAFLITHSMLHLIGYDHMTNDEEVEMFQKQEKVLNKLNITR